MYKMSKTPLILSSAIQERIKALANEIDSVYDYDILISALTGAYMFTADLSRAIAELQQERAFNKQVAFIKASSYGNGTKSSGDLKVTGLENVHVFDKKVLLVDDIADSGMTLLNVWSMLKAAGAKEVRTCVLLNKQERREVDFKVDFVGFEIENEFVVGYGLDYADSYRTLPDIWTLQEQN